MNMISFGHLQKHLAVSVPMLSVVRTPNGIFFVATDYAPPRYRELVALINPFGARKLCGKTRVGWIEKAKQIHTTITVLMTYTTLVVNVVIDAKVTKIVMLERPEDIHNLRLEYPNASFLVSI